MSALVCNLAVIAGMLAHIIEAVKLKMEEQSSSPETYNSTVGRFRFGHGASRLEFVHNTMQSTLVRLETTTVVHYHNAKANIQPYPLESREDDTMV